MTLPLRNRLRVRNAIILFLTGITVMLFASFVSIEAQDDAESEADSRDMLAYVSEDGRLQLYNPRERSEITLLDGVDDFALGRNGRIAFTKADEQDSDLYVFDPATPEIEPINISEGLGEHNTLFGWSSDEQYLAFESYDEGDEHSLYVWDGETSINVMPTNDLDTVDRIYVDWSEDERLAFSLYYGGLELDMRPEIYLWDGNETTNFSQNPEGLDAIWGWSKTGQLMFYAVRDGKFGTYVWDGVSFKNGAADADSFIRVAPEINTDFASWTDEGFVGISTWIETFPLRTKAMLIWDVETESIVDLFSIPREGRAMRFAEVGEMILSSYYAHSQSIRIYESLELINTKNEILFSTRTGGYALSADGYLAYCAVGEADVRWLLSIWDGEDSWIIARVGDIPVQWQHGGFSFSCNID